MKRETITLMLNGLADNYISEAEVFCPETIQEPPERIAHMKKKRIITLALAAALILAAGAASASARRSRNRRPASGPAGWKAQMP